MFIPRTFLVYFSFPLLFFAVAASTVHSLKSNDTTWFDHCAQACREEKKALMSPTIFAPGFADGPITYTKHRCYSSGIPIVVSCGSAVVLSMLYERFAQTHSRARAKKMAILSYFLAAVYGSQLRQRGKKFSNLSPMDPQFTSRLALLFGASTCGTFVLNLFLDWYSGEKALPSTLKQQAAWALEMAALNTYAFAVAYMLDTCP